MYTETKATVLAVCYEDEEIQKLTTDSEAGRAILFKRFTPPVKAGELVWVNTTATNLKLGTGGWDIVRVRVGNYDGMIVKNGETGHIMKARYTPVQHSVLTVEEQQSDFHDVFCEPFSLTGTHVWLAELHSMVPLMYYMAQELRKGIGCCVIFDDQAALPLALSDQLRELHREEYFSSITVGQAFGGQYEAVTLASALQFAKVVLGAKMIVISVGPGVVGTGTVYGFSGMAQANWSNTVSALGGTPIWVPRLSFADKRERHHGLSHHTLTPLSRFTLKEVILPLPYLDEQYRQVIKKQLKEVSFQCRHQIHFAERNQAQSAFLRALKAAKLPLQTMGRSFADDPAFFLAVAEAVRFGLELVSSTD